MSPSIADVRWILEALPVGIWVGEAPDGRVVYSNPEFATILGVDAVESSRITDVPDTYGVFDLENRPYPVDRLPFSRVLTTGQAAVIDDIVVHRPDGQRRNLRAFAYPLHNRAGDDLTHVLVAFVDITKEIQAKAERQLTQAQLRLAVEHAPIVIWATDRDGRVTLSQGAGLASLGVNSGDLVGQNLFELYKDHPAIPASLRRALSGESFWYTVQVGGAVYDTWVTPLTDGGRVTGVVGVSNDVTHLRQLQANIIQNDRVIAMGTLATSVAHEINNPLTYMLGHLDLLSDCLARLGQSTHDVAPSAETQQTAVISRMRESLDLVRVGTQRIAGITQELRTFSRPAAQTSRVDVNAAVTSVLKLVGKELESRARVDVSLADTPTARADMAQLVQVMLNLVINAIQALPAGHAETSHIWISTAVQGDRVIIEVADNGPGVPSENRDRVFEPFLTTKGVGEGSGLGLFVCRNIVNAWGGTVSVDERPGGGARFRVVLPADAGTPMARIEPEPIREPVQSAGPLLIIDDDPAVAAVLVKQLERAGYRVLLETDADRALARLLSGQHAIELVYCDLMMKGTSGMDLAERLAMEAPAMLGRVVFMTGGAFTPRARDFRSAHAGQCVDKPFDIVAETARRLTSALR